MPNFDLKDPIQGFDVEVALSPYDQSNSTMLVGRFTSILVRVVNVTETYLELNERMPRHLDGEVNIVWQCERGMLDTSVLGDTFGFFANNEIGRGTKIKRARRFTITFSVNVTAEHFVDSAMSDSSAQKVYQSNGNAVKTYTLNYCKVDTMSFGATSGRNIVANQWQGTAEGIKLS